jgi:hypothetical protein
MNTNPIQQIRLKTVQKDDSVLKIKNNVWQKLRKCTKTREIMKSVPEHDKV